MDPNRQKRLNEIAAIAVRIEAETLLPARLMIAQWAVESQWGSQPAGKANYFGMKKASRHTLSCWVDTHEVVNGKLVPQRCCFADYDSLEESCRDYAWLITHGAPYQQAWVKFRFNGDFDSFARAVLREYATAQYGQLALEIAGQANVRDAIAAAAAENGNKPLAA